MAEEKKQISEKLQAIVDQVSQLSVLELADLVKAVEEKFGVTAAMPMAAAGPVAGQAPAEAAEEKTTFNVELTEGGANKIGVIKALREVIQIGLKDAKDLVEAAPKIVKEGAGKAEAEEMKKKLEAAGAKVTLK